LKHGKKLTLKEKILLKEQGYNPELYLRVKRTAECLTFVDIDTNKQIEFRY
jgi:hypothetical protein